MMLFGIVAVLLIAQPDLGQTILIGSVWGAMFFMAGMPWLWIVVLGALGVALYVQNALTSVARGLPVTLLDQPFAALDGPSVRCVRELLEDAANHTTRAWVVADHEAPPGLRLAGDIAL